ncbi:MAG: hypothetical protein SGJ20_19205 [Planctomycetota bacterium]|nr:hypothetical protein [Planctomycetota bacterium]
MRTDPERFLEDYLNGKFASYDAHCGSYFPIDEELAKRLLQITRARLATKPSRQRKWLLKEGEKLFEEWVQCARN